MRWDEEQAKPTMAKYRWNKPWFTVSVKENENMEKR